MKAIFELPPDSPLAASITEDGCLLPLRIPHGWAIFYNTLEARRLPDGRFEANDSEDLFWARTTPDPWLKEVAADDDVRVQELHLDVGWYSGAGFRICLLAPDWDHVHSRYTTTDLEDLVATLEAWMTLIGSDGRLPPV